MDIVDANMQAHNYSALWVHAEHTTNVEVK